MEPWWFPPGERAGRRLSFPAEVPEYVWFAANEAGIYAVYPGFFGMLVGEALRPLESPSAGVPRIIGFQRHLWVASDPPAVYDGAVFHDVPLPGALAGFVEPWLVCATAGEYALLRQRLS